MGEARTRFRPFEAGVALLGGAALVAVGPLRDAFATLPGVTVAAALILLLAPGLLLARWFLNGYFSGVALVPAGFVLGVGAFALLAVPMLIFDASLEAYLWAAAALVVVAVISITSGWRMHVDEKEALVAAQQAVGFPVGHASAQQVWRGLRSRPTWRVLCYSTEDPPTRRGLVLVDAVDGRVVEHLVEDNPERWSAAPPTPPDRV